MSSQDQLQCCHCAFTETFKTIANGPGNEALPCYFDNIDEEMVSKASSLTKGADGPSQLDAMQYHH